MIEGDARPRGPLGVAAVIAKQNRTWLVALSVVMLLAAACWGSRGLRYGLCQYPWYIHLDSVAVSKDKVRLVGRTIASAEGLWCYTTDLDGGVLTVGFVMTPCAPFTGSFDVVVPTAGRRVTTVMLKGEGRTRVVYSSKRLPTAIENVK